jgi:hypothetical protein
MDLKVNIHFNNQNTENINELYLYYRLRMFASRHGGCFSGFNFSKTEKYDVLPKLKALGWISGEKVTKYRKLVIDNNCSMLYTNITEDHLVDIKTFKGAMIAISEKYLLEVKHSISSGRRKKVDSLGRKVKVNWDNLRVASKKALKTEKKIDTDGSKVILGRAFNDELCRIMNLSKSTVSRWRKESKENCFNTYDLKSIRVDKPTDKDFKGIAKRRVKLKSTYTSKIDEGVFTKDLIITSSIPLFSINPKKVGVRKASFFKDKKFYEKEKNNKKFN